jgi:hypothetical protein
MQDSGEQPPQPTMDVLIEVQVGVVTVTRKALIEGPGRRPPCQKCLRASVQRVREVHREDRALRQQPLETVSGAVLKARDGWPSMRSFGFRVLTSSRCYASPAAKTTYTPGFHWKCHLVGMISGGSSGSPLHDVAAVDAFDGLMASPR